MKSPLVLLLLVALLAPLEASADPLIVLGKNKVWDAGAHAPPPADRAQAAFIRAVASERARGDGYTQTFTFINPPAWGRVVSPNTQGTLDIRESFPGGLLCRVHLGHLLPEHRYILCLNGRPDHPGNEFFADPVTPGARERYTDFLLVTTDRRGSYRGELAIFLHPGPYNARFYVKDPDDFKIVLYRDYFDFVVE